MSTSSSVSPMRPLIVGALVGFVFGLLIGLSWAWLVQPATYAGGAYPNEMSEDHQLAYVKSVSEAYLATRDVGAASNRLQTFSTEQKVALLATVAKDFAATGQTAESALIGDLAGALSADWDPKAVSAGLEAADASPDFAMKVGQVRQEGDTSAGGQALAEKQDSGSSIGRIIAIVLVVILAIILVLFLLTRIKPKRKSLSQVIPQEMLDAAGDTELTPLRQWVGTYTLGQDSYDESFAIETPESDFLGECGMGILDGFAGGVPKHVLAFDVWLFDKTDIRTISVPVMSEFSFNDENLRGKIQPDANPVLATVGNMFEIETSALSIKAKILEVVYGDDPPPNGYFNTLKVSLSAYLKPGVDTAAPMGVPKNQA